MRTINSKNYCFGNVAIDVVMKFIEKNRDKYEPVILIGIEGGGCEFIWGDPRKDYFCMKIFENFVDLESTFLTSNPGSVTEQVSVPTGFISHSILDIKNAIKLINLKWY